MRTQNSKKMEEILMDVLENDEDATVSVIDSFRNLELLTGNNGFVIAKDGIEYEITIVER